MKRKTPGEQQRQDLPGHNTGAKFVLDLEKCVYSRGNTGCARFGDPTSTILKKQYYSTTITTTPATHTRDPKGGNPAMKDEHGRAHCYGYATLYNVRL